MASVNDASGTNLSILIYIFIIAIIVFIGFLRNRNGRRYRPRRLLIRPIIYLLLGLIISLENISFLPFVIVAVFAGFLVGMRYGESVTLFHKDEQLYYKRSSFIYGVWLVLLLVRLSLEFLFPTNITISLIIDSMLMFSAGLLIGESYHVLRMANFMKKGLI
ncbi:hypothetical protein L3N51_01744 [Metallosphaera sp. J1]|uniref:CcdC protein domain-containing protein n=1 Tax=Metallosphaera TaxID=41980 RepID=UPI001EDDDC45|nr:CcdC protein domain-containing protein [Metallosphaera javensis (ex Hofmann et al. 2022)]MCG3109452.1 hypothetical protein [Metallosphaera javensis (ex Hofmann et al. 2022)]BCS93518.1 MAG: hypothetical protein MjAS7_2126 [Metallosphaera javensis (ex Sakai et al. 2022)]